ATVETVLQCAEHELVAPDGFAFRSLYGFELTDATRGRIIKRAHDLCSTIVEFHSHPFPCQAKFSLSDRAGLEEVAPHVRWRLRGKPYVAVVVAPTSFDALVWAGEMSAPPRTLDGIRVGTNCLRPTGLSEQHWRVHNA